MLQGHDNVLGFQLDPLYLSAACWSTSAAVCGDMPAGLLPSAIVVLVVQGVCEAYSGGSTVQHGASK